MSPSRPALALIERLGLVLHPEGGWYREVYRSSRQLPLDNGPRSALTTIYYLLERGQVSRWHVTDADEAWHFYSGGPLELLAYEPRRRELVRHVLGDGQSGSWVAVVPAGWWQAARPVGEYALAGCSVAPGFEFSGFQFVESLPEHRDHLAGQFGFHADLL